MCLFIYNFEGSTCKWEQGILWAVLNRVKMHYIKSAKTTSTKFKHGKKQNNTLTEL